MSKKELRRRPPRAAKKGTESSNTLLKDYNDPNHMKGKMETSAIILGLTVILVVFGLVGYFWYVEHRKEQVRTPLDSPPIIFPDSTSAAHNPERFWGTFRPQLYFGLKVRSPESPVFGLMWMRQFQEEMPPAIRHWCDQGDHLAMYSWFAHDGQQFGIQNVIDKYFSILMDFVKRPGGQHGGDWTSRFHVTPMKGAEEAVVSVFFYVALDGQGSIGLSYGDDGKPSGIRGTTEELGSFNLIFAPEKASKLKMDYATTYAPSLASLKEAMMNTMSAQMWDKNRRLPYLAISGNRMPPEHANKQPNYIIFQFTAKLPQKLEVIFESGSFTSRPNQLSKAVYQAELQQHLTAFDDKFESLFHLKAKGFDADQIGFAKAAFSNLVGGIGYWHGSSIVSSKHTKKEDPLMYWSAPLYTAVPSRPFFPRGFLWDEGFHNLLISKWDPEISKEIIGHWLDLMNIEGWIPREQILTDEARAKVPEQFLVQKNENANPPTFFLPLQLLVKQLISSDKAADKTYLKNLFPRLQVWYNWYNITQVGEQPLTYRWRGRDPNNKKQLNPLTLTSGLDDSPRSSHPSDQERHVDLRCWIALASEVMWKIAEAVGEPHEAYKVTYQLLTDNQMLDNLHWSEKGQQYSDYGLHTDSVKLVRPQVPRQPGMPPPKVDKERVVKKQPILRHVDSFGYISLFPFAFKIIDPSSLKLGKVLKDLQDPNLVWTKFGIRSLAKTAPLYNKHNTEHDPPYWRGAIWINFNYLILRALHHYANEKGPHQDTAAAIYKELRENLIKNMYEQFRVTGYIWENYDDVTGKGKGSHPFTGWSALIVSIMSEQY